MSTITIGTDSRDLVDADPQWINHAIVARRRDGQDICVIFDLDGDLLKLILRAPRRAGGRGVDRSLSHREREVLELWAKLGLNDPDFAPGNVVAFVQQVKHYL